MRWDYGEVFREVRLAKGLTQAEVCGDYLSRTSLAKFEANQVTPRFETMVFLLRQLDMDLAEFEYLCHYRQVNPRKVILDNFKKIRLSKEVEVIDQLIEQCQVYLKTHQDIPISNILNACQLYKGLLGKNYGNPDALQKKIANLVWQELAKRGTWYLSDIKQVSMILTYFSPDQLEHITDRLLNSLDKYSGFYDLDLQDSAFSILANMSTIYLYEDRIDKCYNVTERALGLAQQSKEYDKLAFCQIRLGLCSQNKKLIQSGISLLELTQEEAMLKRFRQEIDKFQPSLD